MAGSPIANAPHFPRANTRLRNVESLPRPRLLDLLAEFWESGAGLVVAPGGSGKTTLLAQFAAAADCPFAYYCADSRDADARGFLGTVARSLALIAPGIEGGWTTGDEAAFSLERGLKERTLLLVDDFHLLERTRAEEALEQLLASSPPQLGVLIASRSRPRFNWPRLLVSGALIEVGGDDLRFRSREVELLFAGVYTEPLPLEDLTEVERLTEGWAAGLKLLHVAARGRPSVERRRILRSLGRRWSHAREYLMHNVLEGLEPELRDFLDETCVLTRLSGELCDDLLGRQASGRLLRELEARQLFTYELDDGSYRYHQVMRSQLEAELVERLGEAKVRARFQRAGDLLAIEESLPDALYAYCRAQAWGKVDGLLGCDGHRIADGRPVWLDVLPGAILRADPWLQVAVARRQLALGRFAAATETYRAAELCAAQPAAIEISRRERIALAAWVEPSTPPTLDPLGLLRSATIGDPRLARRQAARVGTPEARAVSGLAALLEGRCREAAALLADARDEIDQSGPFAAAAQLGVAVAHLLADDPGGAAEARLAAELADRAGVPWLASLAHASLALAHPTHGGRCLTAVGFTSEARREEWGVHLSSLFEALGALACGEAPVEQLDETANGFRKVGARTLEAWARGAHVLALARTGDPEARDAALRVEKRARRSGVVAARALACLALAQLDPDPASEFRTLARSLNDECGLRSLLRPAAAPVREPLSARSEPTIVIHCLGGLRLTVDGREFDLRTVKPRARSLLRLLAMQEGRPVHREVLMEALWPECDLDTGARNLHVLVSNLRRALEPGRGRGDDTLVQRYGDAYRLVLPDGAQLDLMGFRDALAKGRESTDPELAAIAYASVLDIYAGELFPEEGPAEWVLDRREQLLEEAIVAARSLAEALLALGDAAAAANACRRGLALDVRDATLWRLCAEAYESAGDPLSAAQARERQSRVVA